MTFKKLLIASTILSSILLAHTPAQAAEKSASQGEVVVVSETARQSAMRFVNLVNNARYMLAAQDVAGAKGNINQAKTEADKLTRLTATERKITGVQSGRVTYEQANDDDDQNMYYYPVETGRVTTKEIGLGPFWSRDKGLAVKDAEILYVTVDLSTVNTQKQLNEALAEINENDLDDAEEELQELVDSVIVIEDSNEALALKARDNLELTRNYMAAKNYDAARYPLKHARNALEKMEGNEDYASQQNSVKKYLADLNRYERTIESKDPTALEKMQSDWNKMWDDMKTWVEKKTS